MNNLTGRGSVLAAYMLGIVMLSQSQTDGPQDPLRDWPWKPMFEPKKLSTEDIDRVKADLRQKRQRGRRR
jgi:hypothetical protein